MSYIITQTTKFHFIIKIDFCRMTNDKDLYCVQLLRSLCVPFHGNTEQQNVNRQFLCGSFHTEMNLHSLCQIQNKKKCFGAQIWNNHLQIVHNWEHLWQIMVSLVIRNQSVSKKEIWEDKCLYLTGNFFFLTNLVLQIKTLNMI